MNDDRWYAKIFLTMFGKIKNYATKKLLDRQLKDVPEGQRQMIMEMFEKDPELLNKIAKEMQDEMKKNGNNQMAAAMKVMPKYQQQLQSAMSPQTREQLMRQQMGAQGQFNPDGSIRK